MTCIITAALDILDQAGSNFYILFKHKWAGHSKAHNNSDNIILQCAKQPSLAECIRLENRAQPGGTTYYWTAIPFLHEKTFIFVFKVVLNCRTIHNQCVTDILLVFIKVISDKRLMHGSMSSQKDWDLDKKRMWHKNILSYITARACLRHQ